ncbi:MAG TPA: di-trans,poly-cis-decaprenylcistransferase [Gemmatimonadales bacterium]|nr:di-trans,poly-cis-decaprenylcistransferase [Gemmatimonadales bacterium]
MAGEGLHVAIIMDGNGRWAERRGLPRRAGHREGARAVERVVEAAPRLGIGTLTLFAFSSDNWQRPMPEVSALMRLFRSYLRSERERAVQNGVAVEVFGRRDRLPVSVLAELAETEAATAGGTRLRLRLAVDYSARDAILRAAVRLAGDSADPTREDFESCLAAVDNARGPVPAVDVLIRTGGEQRLSDFLLWESAYAELFFRPTMWPDFSPAELADVLREFGGRERRFGRVQGAARSHLRLTR